MLGKSNNQRTRTINELQHHLHHQKLDSPSLNSASVTPFAFAGGAAFTGGSTRSGAGAAGVAGAAGAAGGAGDGVCTGKAWAWLRLGKRKNTVMALICRIKGGFGRSVGFFCFPIFFSSLHFKGTWLLARRTVRIYTRASKAPVHEASDAVTSGMDTLKYRRIEFTSQKCQLD